MVRIAYVDHSYHKKTLSTAFLVQLMRLAGHEVDVFWDRKWEGKTAITFESVKDYDVVIMFQATCTPLDEYYAKKHPNVLHIPMLDQLGLCYGPSFHLKNYWEPFQGCKILSFSRSLHAMTTAAGICSLPVRFYQTPEAFPEKSSNLRGFFWLRNESFVSWPMIRTLIGETRFESLHIHLAPDPDSLQPTLPSNDEITKYNITISTWFKNKADFINILNRANVFFASRLEEGIGQSFLEALARGQCVVAPDNGTMNEYIIHGVNGLLYSPKSLSALDFSNIHMLRENAWHSAKAGHDLWKKQIPSLIDFILMPSAHFYDGEYQHPALKHASMKITTITPFRVRLFNYIRRLSLVQKTRKYWSPIWNAIKKRK